MAGKPFAGEDQSGQAHGADQEAAESEPWHHHLRKGEIPIGISQALSGASMAKHSRSGHFSKRWRQAGQVMPFGTSVD